MDEIIVKLQLESDFTPEEKRKFYNEIINGLNDMMIPVLSITNEGKTVFNNTKGFVNLDNEIVCKPGQLVKNKKSGDIGIYLSQSASGSVTVLERIQPYVICTHDSWDTLEIVHDIAVGVESNYKLPEELEPLKNIFVNEEKGVCDEQGHIKDE